MSDVKWETLREEPIADYQVFTVAKTQARSPRTGEVMDFHVIRRRHCVQVVPITDDGRVILVEQFRHGVQHLSLEFPAGTMDDGEDPVEAALRELKEETGYEAAGHEIIGVLEPDTALENTRITVVAAFGCRATNERSLDDGEAIRVSLKSCAQVDALMRAGKITLAPAIAAWFLYSGGRD